jgi:hypothetical protein
MAGENKLRVFLDANILIRGVTMPRFPYETLQPGSFLREIMGWSHDDLSAIERRCWQDLERPFWMR